MVSLAYMESASFTPLGNRKHSRSDGSSDDGCLLVVEGFGCLLVDGFGSSIISVDSVGDARLFASSSSILDLLPIIELWVLLLLTVADTAHALVESDDLDFLSLELDSFKNFVIFI